MNVYSPEAICWLALALLAACAPPPRPAAPSGAGPTTAEPTRPGPEQRSGPPQRIVAATTNEPDIFPSISIPGDDELRTLVNGGLAIVDSRGNRSPQLAEITPALENGLWKLQPDGRMETTWRIRPNALWHDGTPFTAEDLLFTARVAQDKELAAFGHAAYASIESMDAADPRTLRVTWSRPYIDADALFSLEITPPLPRHLLEKAYVDDKSTFTQVPYWSQEYVGTGPYRMKERVPGSHLVLAANDRYVLGRPRIDEIEIRFISDTNALIANLLSGSVDLTLGRALSVEQAIQLREQWANGKVSLEFGSNSWLVLIPQFVNPSPPVITDLEFRRALMHAIDRQEMADSLNGGLAPVAHSFLSPDQPQYRDIEARVMRYEFDPRQAAQMIEALGFAKGPDGHYRDGQGQRLEIEIRNIGLEISRRSMFAVADYWQRIGIPVSTIVIPPQRVADFEYRSTFPGFPLFNQPNDLRGLPNLHSSRARLPSNNFQVPGAGNHSRYMSPELDGLLDRYFTTIPREARIQALAQIIYHIAEHLNVMGLFYNGNPDAMANRLEGLTTGRAASSLLPWNAHEWNVP